MGVATLTRQVLEYRGIVDRSSVDRRSDARRLNGNSARIAYLGLGVASPIAAALDTIGGLACAVPALGSLGLKESIVNRAGTYLSSSRGLVAVPYALLLSTINPETRPFAGQSIIDRKGDGFVTEFVKSRLRSKFKQFRNSDNLFVRHVVSRLTQPLKAMACLVTRAVDAVIGIIAAFFSILAALIIGNVVSLNRLAARGLMAPGIISDLYRSAINFINPWAGMSPEDIAREQKQIVDARRAQAQRNQAAAAHRPQARPNQAQAV